MCDKLNFCGGKGKPPCTLINCSSEQQCFLKVLGVVYRYNLFTNQPIHAYLLQSLGFLHISSLRFSY